MEPQCAKYHLPWGHPSNCTSPTIFPHAYQYLVRTSLGSVRAASKKTHVTFAEDRDVEAPTAVRELLQGPGFLRLKFFGPPKRTRTSFAHSNKPKPRRLAKFLASRLFLSAKKCFGAVIASRMPRNSRRSKVDSLNPGQRIENSLQSSNRRRPGRRLPILTFATFKDLATGGTSRHDD